MSRLPSASFMVPSQLQVASWLRPGLAIVRHTTTGGAVDLTLAWEGQPLALGTDFDDFTPLAATEAFEEPGRNSQIRLLRRALAAGLTMAGFVNHRLGYEWWHWSFGDDTWADFNRCSALYGIASLDDVDDAISVPTGSVIGFA